MSFHEISIAVRAENRASATFRGLALDVANLGAYFGILSNEQVKAVSVMFTVIRVVNTMSAIAKTGAAAQLVYAATSKAAAVATWILNASLAAKITLLTLGAGAVVVAAAAMAALAMQTRGAASAMREYNAAASEGAGYTRSITRAGEEDLLRRGIE